MMRGTRHDLIGKSVRCLAAPTWAPLEYADMVGQRGVIKNCFPADPDDPEGEDFVGIQYPRTPYSDNTIALPLSERGETWELIEPAD